MQGKGPAATPPIVRAALWANIVLVAIALLSPRMVSITGNATAFIIPMVLILVIGTAAAIYAYILARREDRPVRWTAFAPLGIFIIGLLATVVLIYTEFFKSGPETI